MIKVTFVRLRHRSRIQGPRTCRDETRSFQHKQGGLASILVSEILMNQTYLHQHKSDLADGIWCPDTGLCMCVIRPGQDRPDRLYAMPICRPPSPVMRVMCCIPVFGGLVSLLPYSQSNCRSKRQLLPSKRPPFAELELETAAMPGTAPTSTQIVP